MSKWYTATAYHNNWQNHFVNLNHYYEQAYIQMSTRMQNSPHTLSKTHTHEHGPCAQICKRHFLAGTHIDLREDVKP